MKNNRIQLLTHFFSNKKALKDNDFVEDTYKDQYKYNLAKKDMERLSRPII